MSYFSILEERLELAEIDEAVLSGIHFQGDFFDLFFGVFLPAQLLESVEAIARAELHTLACIEHREDCMLSLLSLDQL